MSHLSCPPCGGACLMLWLLTAAWAPAQADDTRPLRDPMQAPAAGAAPAATAAGALAAPPPPPPPRHIVVAAGQRWLVISGRRLTVGDKLGSARIEAIEDAAVWVHEGGQRTRLDLYGRIAKRPVPAEPTVLPGETAVADAAVPAVPPRSAPTRHAGSRL